jgi:hypothetical protein
MRSHKAQPTPPATPFTPVRSTLPAQPALPRKAKKKPKANRGRGKKPHGLTVVMESEDESESENDPQGVALPVPKPKPSELVERLEETAKMLESVGDANDVEEYLIEGGTLNPEQIKSLQESCATIANLLASKAVQAPSPASTLTVTSTVPSTIVAYDDFYIYATLKYLYVLKPIDVFKLNNRFTEVKVLGFIRRKGGMPLMFALPGWLECTDGHPRMLDSELWAKQVKYFTDFHEFKFSRKVWDDIHNQEHGQTYRCHVELRLMIWFACRMLVKALGVALSWQAQIVRLELLKDLVKNVEAEIILTKAPCKSCRRFRKWFQKLTGIKFTISTCSTLEMEGIVEEEEKETREETEDRQVFEKDVHKTKLAVVIRETPVPSEPASRGARERSSFGTEFSAKFTLSKNKKHKTYNLTPATPSSESKKSQKKKWPFENDASDSEDDDYRPTPAVRRSQPGSSFENPQKKTTRSRSDASSPEDSDQFGNHNLERISKLNREKRKREMEMEAAQYPSPPSGKKARRSRSSETLRGRSTSKDV